MKDIVVIVLERGLTVIVVLLYTREVIMPKQIHISMTVYSRKGITSHYLTNSSA